MKQPPLIIPDTVEVAQATLRKLTNGINLYTLPCEEFEVLRVTFVFHAGSSQQQIPFSASATANLLAEGSRDLTAQQIAEQLDYYGSYYDVNIDRDYAYISFCMLSKFFTETLSVAGQILLHPTFPEYETATYCAKRRQELSIERTKVEVQAREEFARTLFGAEHPYGISSPESKYDSLTRSDIEAFFAEYYTAENCFVVCSGHITEPEMAAIAHLAAQIPQAQQNIAAPLPAPVTGHTSFVKHSEAVQSSLRLGRLLFPRQHPDFVSMQVVATLLGGYFSSRLMHNLREEHGYTYGVMAAMVNFEKEGYLAIATQVGAEVTEDALEQIYTEIERLRTEIVPEQELALVKNIMIGEMMRILDGPFGIADVTIENILCGTDNQIIEENLRHIQAVTPADIQRLAQKYLSKSDLVTVIVGPEKPKNL